MASSRTNASCGGLLSTHSVMNKQRSHGRPPPIVAARTHSAVITMVQASAAPSALTTERP